ncbi:PIN domain-containing protein [Actinomadura sp. NPDC000600]|uniref:PIN domain-containing protein n=1 Tax=Actinomadura sp. NPDC000600 TaxID=3154262 RepID=UPI00339173C8
MILREGRDIDDAVRAIRQLANSAGTVRTGVADEPKANYIKWVDDCERQLRNIFTDTDIAKDMITDRYWRLTAEGAGASLAFHTALGAEIEVQRDRLNALADKLEELAKVARRPGQIVIPDCNFYVHCMPMQDVKWCDVLKVEQVRLVMPYAVLDELDKVKDMKGDRSNRARNVLKYVDQLIPDYSKSDMGELRDKVTFEIFPDEPDHRRRWSMDEEIVDRGLLLQRLAGQPVLILSDDRGMRIRTQRRGLQSRGVDDLRPPTT